MKKKGVILAAGAVGLVILAIVWGAVSPAFAPGPLRELARTLGLNHGPAGAPITLAVAVDNPAPGGTGATIVNGMQLLIDDVNRNGGIQGRPLRVEVYDDAGSPQRSREVAETIGSRSSAVAVIGHRLSGASKAAGEVYSRHGIVAISPASTSVDVTAGNPWFFRTAFHNDFLGRFITRYLHAVIAPRQPVVLVSGHHNYGQWLLDLIRSEAGSIGMPVSASILADAADTPENRAAIQTVVDTLRAVTDGPRVLFLSQYPEEAVPLIRAVRDAGLNDVVIFGPDSLDRMDFPTLFRGLPQEQRTPGYYTNGVIIASSLVYDTAGREAGFFRETYVQRFGAEPDWRAALAYDAGKAVVAALRGVMEEDTPDQERPLAEVRKAVRDRLAAIDSIANAVDGIAGPVFFNGDGDANRPAGIARYQNGRIVSAFDQFQALRTLPDGTRLDDLVRAGQIIDVGGRLYQRTQVVFSGLLLQDIARIDLSAMSADVTGEMWVRYARGHTTEAPDPMDVTFLNALGPVKLEPLAEQVADGGIVYKRQRFSGSFRVDFVPGMRSYRHPMVGVEFRHRTVPSNRLLYVADLQGMGMTGGIGYTGVVGRLAPALETQGWSLREGTVFQGVEMVSSLGDPRYLGQPSGSVPYSTFVAVVRLGDVATLSLSAIPPDLRALIVLGGLSVLILIAMGDVCWPGLRLSPMLIVAEILIVAVVLAVAKEITIDALQNELPFQLLDGIERLYSMSWWLAGAYFLTLILRRFGWEPLERKSGRAVPAILKHFMTTVIVLLAVFGIIAFVFHQPLTSLLATSGLLTLIIGLAVQSNIANIFAGIILSLERPFSIGDTIKFGDMDPARVFDMSWRTTRLEDGFGYVRSIPNSKVAESTVINYSRRTPARDFQHVLLPPEVPPEKALTIMARALTGCRKTVQDGNYGTSFLGLHVVGNITAARYSVSYNVEDYFQRWGAREEVALRVWQALAAEGIPAQIDNLRLPDDKAKTEETTASSVSAPAAVL